MIGLLLLAGLAHLGPVWQAHDAALRAGDDFALVEVKAATRHAGQAASTEVATLDVIAGRPPARFTMRQTGGVTHDFSPGQLALVPVRREGAGWCYLAGTRKPLLVERGNRRPAVAFARDWRASQAKDVDLDAWIDLLGHPARVARRLAYQALLGQADHLVLTPARLDRIADPLALPGQGEDASIDRVRLLGALAGRAGSRRIAERFDRLASDRVRRVAVGVLARFPGKDARATLERCARHASGSLKTRCVRAAQRLRGPRAGDVERPPAPAPGARLPLRRAP